MKRRAEIQLPSYVNYEKSLAKELICIKFETEKFCEMYRIS